MLKQSVMLYLHLTYMRLCNSNAFVILVTSRFEFHRFVQLIETYDRSFSFAP
ncbi:hypothetical protein Pla100_62150 [Neorhodopirellula pilleata]|uniref:Uncharacterized protein n=1 Tax=Neorhodopirellula pilleata TaxID=2714738 RepID=A0A5C5ZG41_9BACT|nr:hypothetical protein Pla100_62150 [Neorhodopirellula pilleata]